MKKLKTLLRTVSLAQECLLFSSSWHYFFLSLKLPSPSYEILLWVKAFKKAMPISPLTYLCDSSFRIRTHAGLLVNILFPLSLFLSSCSCLPLSWWPFSSYATVPHPCTILSVCTSDHSSPCSAFRIFRTDPGSPALLSVLSCCHHHFSSGLLPWPSSKLDLVTSVLKTLQCLLCVIWNKTWWPLDLYTLLISCFFDPSSLPSASSPKPH